MLVKGDDETWNTKPPPGRYPKRMPPDLPRRTGFPVTAALALFPFATFTYGSTSLVVTSTREIIASQFSMPNNDDRYAGTFHEFPRSVDKLCTQPTAFEP